MGKYLYYQSSASRCQYVLEASTDQNNNKNIKYLNLKYDGSMYYIPMTPISSGIYNRGGLNYNNCRLLSIAGLSCDGKNRCILYSRVSYPNLKSDYMNASLPSFTNIYNVTDDYNQFMDSNNIVIYPSTVELHRVRCIGHSAEYYSVLCLEYCSATNEYYARINGTYQVFHVRPESGSYVVYEK